MKRFILFILISALGSALFSCTVLRPYEQVYLNDPQMKMNHHPGLNFGNYVHSIREGSIPAGSVKSGGGCGCN